MCIPIRRIFAASLLLLFLPLNGFAQETDTDNDGILDETDNCPAIANDDQIDTDSDGSGDACDDDDDNDSIADADDLYPLDNTKHQNTPYVITFEGVIDYVSDSVEGKEPHQIKSGDTYRYTLVFDNHNGSVENQTWGRTYANSDIEYLLLTIEGESSGTLMVDVANMRPIPGLFGSSLNSFQGTSGLDIETDGTGTLSKVWNDVTFLGLGDDIRLDWYQSYGWIAPNVAAAIRLQARSATVAESSSSYTTQSSWAFTGIDQTIRVEDQTQWSAVTPAACAGPLTLSSQADVDAVLTNVCTRIEGDLIIDGTAIRDLSPLRIIRTVDGQLTITPDMSAPTLNGLQGVSHINRQAVVDSDGDYHPDFMDDYPNDNAAAFDTDGDGLPNEWLPGKFSSSVDSSLTVDNDDDGDGTIDWEDDLPLDASETVDTDRDGIGNNADSDDDGDGVEDGLDAFPLDVAASVDDDQDGAPDAWNGDATEAQIAGSELSIDAFPGDGSETIDTDGDGTGNNADLDDDNDTYPDIEDDFPLDATEWLDTDGDGIGNNADPNDDNDAIPDENDAFPLDPTEVADRDGDGIGNNSDPDLDGDGVDNEVDAFPYTPGEWADTDGDFIGDNADTDDDNDSVPDTEDAFPLDASESVDTDGDGVGDNADAFPYDAIVASDADNDGYPDPVIGSLLPKTSQSRCFDLAGSEIACEGTGQDGDIQAGADYPNRFVDHGDGTVTDRVTQLTWTRQVNCAEGLNWQEALDYVGQLGSGQCGLSDGSSAGDWRLPNIRELDSLVDRATTDTQFYLNFPEGHPFEVSGASQYWSWSSTTHPREPIYSHSSPLFGGMSGLLKTRTDKAGTWAVKNTDQPSLLPKTGQTTCYSLSGDSIDCAGTGQDGDYQAGMSYPNRFIDRGDGSVVDTVTNLIWTRQVNCVEGVNWQQALDYVEQLSSGQCGLSDGSSAGDWRLPNIRELDSIIDRAETDTYSYLNFTAGHPFVIGDDSEYWSWSSTNHTREPIYATASVLSGGASGLLKTRTDKAGAWAVRESLLVEDAFPNDPAASVDTDGDGYPDEWNEGTTAAQIMASPLRLDAFPSDPAVSMDTDGDGYPDAWNIGATQDQITASDLTLDAFPSNPDEWADADQDGVGANTDVDDNDPESDSDNDGLSDSAERDYGSDPQLADTDGDGFTDGEEVAAGTSPTDIDDIPMVDEEDEIRGFPLWLIEVLKARESATAPQ